MKYIKRRRKRRINYTGGQQIYLKEGMDMDIKFEYLAVVASGIGPDVWDTEVMVHAKNIKEAIEIIESIERDAYIISIEQVD